MTYYTRAVIDDEEYDLNKLTVDETLLICNKINPDNLDVLGEFNTPEECLKGFHTFIEEDYTPDFFEWTGKGIYILSAWVPLNCAYISIAKTTIECELQDVSEDCEDRFKLL